MSDVPSIRIADIHKSFGSLEVLRGVSFDVQRGKVVSVIGASGSGKSTLLRCVNYLEPPSPRASVALCFARSAACVIDVSSASEGRPRGQRVRSIR